MWVRMGMRRGRGDWWRGWRTRLSGLGAGRMLHLRSVYLWDMRVVVRKGRMRVVRGLVLPVWHVLVLIPLWIIVSLLRSPLRRLHMLMMRLMLMMMWVLVLVQRHRPAHPWTPCRPRPTA